MSEQVFCSQCKHLRPWRDYQNADNRKAMQCKNPAGAVYAAVKNNCRFFEQKGI